MLHQPDPRHQARSISACSTSSPQHQSGRRQLHNPGTSLRTHGRSSQRCAAYGRDEEESDDAFLDDEEDDSREPDVIDDAEDFSGVSPFQVLPLHPLQ